MSSLRQFSVVIPAYNRELLICEALDSVRAQAYRPIEIIVVDDGSDDATEDVVRRWASGEGRCLAFAEASAGTQRSEVRQIETETETETDVGGKMSSLRRGFCGHAEVSGQRAEVLAGIDAEDQWEIGDEQFKVRYFYQENAGAAAARNRGMQEIRGEYVQFLDSDDRLHPERLARLVETFETEHCDFIQTGFEGFDAENGEVLSTHYGRLAHDIRSQALMGVLWANTLRSAFSAGLLEKVGLWNVDMSCFEDYEYVIRSLIVAEKPAIIRDVLAGARRGGSSRVSDALKTREGRANRIHCEEFVAQLALQYRHVLGREARAAFVSRIYCLGVRSYARGWTDLGKRCGRVIDELDQRTRRLRLKSKWFYIWLMGPFGGFVYRRLRLV